MIAHQQIRMHAPSGARAGSRQRREEALPILVILIDRFAPVAAIEHVIDRARKFHSGFSGHASPDDTSTPG